MQVEADPPTMYGHDELSVPEEPSGARTVKTIGPVTAECIRKGHWQFIKKTKNETTATPSVNEGYRKTVVKDLFHKKKDQAVPAGQQSVK